ncbi:MAG: hypothetical protein AAF311_15415 [Pseudomonadota bacterium]
MPTRLFLCASAAAFLSACGSQVPTDTPAGAEADMPVVAEAPTPLLAPFTDFYEIEIDAPADVTWTRLKELYVRGDRSVEYGFDVRPLDDMTAYLGGIIASNPDNADRPTVTTKVSALDESARLMTLQIELENPVPVYAIHQVRPLDQDRSSYQTIIMTQWPVAAPDTGSYTADYIRETMTRAVESHKEEVAAIMAGTKADIEARHAAR